MTNLDTLARRSVAELKTTVDAISVPRFEESHIRTVRVRRAIRTAVLAVAVVIVVVGVPLLIGLFAVEEPVTPQTTIPGPVTTTPGSLGSFSWPRVVAGDFIYQPTGPVGGMPVGSMDQWCESCPVGVMADGRVLVMASQSAEFGLLVFDPKSGSWSGTANTRTLWGLWEQMVRLPDGRMLWSGRQAASGGVLEVYDPSSGTFDVPSGVIPEWSVPVLLADGRVLVVWSLSSGAVYDPSDGTVSPVGDASTDYSDAIAAPPSAVALSDGRVLVVGSVDAVVVDPAADDFGFDPQTGRLGESLTRTYESDGHISALLPDGRVLIAGGEAPGTATPLVNAELFDPTTRSFSGVAPMLDPNAWNQAVAIPDGRVVVLGGAQGRVEVFDPETLSFSRAPSLASPRDIGLSATLLDDGRILVVGGLRHTGGDDSNYDFDPGVEGVDWWTTGRTAEIYHPDATIDATGRDLAGFTMVLKASGRGSLRLPGVPPDDPVASASLFAQLEIPPGGLDGASMGALRFHHGSAQLLGGGGDFHYFASTEQVPEGFSANYEFVELFPSECDSGCEILIPLTESTDSPYVGWDRVVLLWHLQYEGPIPPQASEITLTVVER